MLLLLTSCSSSYVLKSEKAIFVWNSVCSFVRFQSLVVQSWRGKFETYSLECEKTYLLSSLVSKLQCIIDKICEQYSSLLLSVTVWYNRLCLVGWRFCNTVCYLINQSIIYLTQARGP